MFNFLKKSEDTSVIVTEIQNLNHFKDYKIKDLKHCFVGYLKGFSAHNKDLSAKTRKLSRINHKTSGYSQAELARNKWLSRHYLLAYGFLSGKEYKSIERQCGETNKPSATIIFNIIKSVCEVTSGRYWIKENLRSFEVIELWLNGGSK